VRSIAPWVEELGFDELWMVEDCFSGGGLTTSAVALACTERIRVGVGLLPVPVRNPAIAAMEIASLARMFPGRFMPAFGHGVDSWMRQIDERPPRRLKLLEETLVTVRALLHGERLNFSGSFVELSEVELEHKPAQPPPVMVGTTGPKGLALTGRVADGIVIPEVATPDAVRWSRAQASSEGDPGTVVAYSYLSLSEKAEEGVAVARPLVERWLQSGDFPDMAEQAGLGRDGRGELDDATLQSMAVAGDAESGARTVAGLWAAGADSVVVLPRHDDSRRQIETFAAQVLPALPR
jgi:alkanesulfonate monooxygenase SsuD/methylene tetrahydromethanopterin reductase-like flavin-dependent oxidoreductase (luciferase family)